MTEPDFRELCAELVDIATTHCNPDDEAVGYCAAVLACARVALAQPKPQGATDEELDASRYLKYIEELSYVLVSCAEMISEWGAYADEYYRKKHSLDADVAYAKSHAARAKKVAEQADKLGEYDD
jgi:hypothetical protein